MIRRFRAATILAITCLAVSIGEAQEINDARSAVQTSKKLIAPFPPDQTRALAFNADVTTPYQKPAARTAADL